MLPAHTQKSLDALTWNEIQKLHTSLGLKATAKTRTRRDYQNRIVATQPQPVVESEAVATPLTCAACPLARRLGDDDNRYCCTAGVTSTTTRGHWEAKTDCYDAVAEAEAETTEIVAEPETPIAQIETALQEIEITALTQPTKSELTATTTDDTPPNRGDNGRGRVEAIAPAIAPRVKIKQPPIWVYVPPDRVQETIVWETPFKGEILGKSGYRRFYVENDVIYVIVNRTSTSTFCASEFASPNYHHKVIRQAIEAGKQFEPSAFKQRAKARGCPSPKYQTYWWKDADGRSCNLGQIYQNCDGWWWAWASQGDSKSHHNFQTQTQIQAQKYLEIEKAIARHPAKLRLSLYG